MPCTDRPARWHRPSTDRPARRLVQTVHRPTSTHARTDRAPTERTAQRLNKVGFGADHCFPPPGYKRPKMTQRNVRARGGRRGTNGQDTAHAAARTDGLRTDRPARRHPHTVTRPACTLRLPAHRAPTDQHEGTCGPCTVLPAGRHARTVHRPARTKAQTVHRPTSWRTRTDRAPTDQWEGTCRPCNCLPARRHAPSSPYKSSPRGGAPP